MQPNQKGRKLIFANISSLRSELGGGLHRYLELKQKLENQSSITGYEFTLTQT